MVPRFPASGTPSISGDSMEIDSDPFHHSQHYGWVSSILQILDTLQEVVPKRLEADVELSRHRISVFLSTHTAYELLPESGKVVALDVTLPVKQAFHILYEQGISVAPLWDHGIGRFVGILSPLDFILILRELGNHGSNLTEEELETHAISAWKAGKLQLTRKFDGNGSLNPRHLIDVLFGGDGKKMMGGKEGLGWVIVVMVELEDGWGAGPHDSLKDVALKLLQNKVATVPVISWDGSIPQLLHLASLTGVLKCICRHFKHSPTSLPILQQPICSIPLGTWVPKIGESNGHPFAMLRANASLSDALSLLVQAEVSAVPIVDDNDSLLDIYCRSDITALAKDRAYAQIHLNELSIHQVGNKALQLTQEASATYGFFNGQRCHMCLRSDPLHKVMDRLAIPGVRRLVIVEAGSKRVEGIISLTDLFRFLLG
ncbi:Cystathionine beta-synthase, core [Cynara cardunculus var. scolymus]|uniref:Cystathionine beta-synthase, core n=1 Tax=Cynara cardunculus var. scolymus TaxID=59895 RepID=A0A103XMN3_CYNCS|nr:Cystathionine beta-synthase, core [Cynara cardunculus var. scolymus]